MPTFFDVIPDDIHDLIAHFLYSSTNYPEGHSCETCLSHSIADDNLSDTLLSYAKNSPAQCRSVLMALSNRLYITDDWRSQKVAEWISVSANHLKELDIWDSPDFSFPGNRPTLPKLRKAVIVARPDQISLIYGSPKLRDLTVHIFHSNAWDSFILTVGSLRLAVLQLHFFYPDILRSLSRIELMRLCEVCPAVEIFHLEAPRRLTPESWDMIKGMQSLKQLRLNRYIENEQVPFVKTLQEIALFGRTNVEEVTRFGPLVTNLSFRRAREEEILQFRSLLNLRSLKVSVEHGHERALVGIINNIEELALSWDHRGCYHSFESPYGAEFGWHPVYYEPDEEVLLEIMRNAKHLKSLHINKAILSSDVVIKFLQISGGRFKKLEVCHDWQKESVPSRMERILKGITRYCPNLKTLTFLESTYHYGHRSPIFATKEHKIRCFRALDDVSLAVSGFRSYRHVRSTILNRFTEERSEQLTWHDMLQGLCIEIEVQEEVDDDNGDDHDEEDE